MKRFLVTAGVLPLIAACAQSPESIAPAAMPGGMYSHLSCADARTEYRALATQRAALESSQRAAVAGDAIGVFLIGVPTSSLAGGDKAGDLATVKGQQIALEARLGRC